MSDFGLEEIEEQWVEEKASTKLAEMSEKFYENVAGYMSDLERELESSKDLRHELLREEIGWVAKMTREIHFFRTLKAMESIVKGSIPPSLLERERRGFEEIKDILEELQEGLPTPAIGGEAEIRPPREKANVLLLISSELPQFVGDDMRTYGPFKSGEVANLPKHSAELLRRRGLARKLQIGSISD